MKHGGERLNELDVDDLIGCVAREMTEGVPAPTLRARVIDRLPARRSAAWAALRLPLAAAGVLAAALVATAGPAWREWMATKTRPATVAVDPVAAVAPKPDTDAREIISVEPASRAVAGRVARPPLPSEVAWLERAVPALAEVEAPAMTDIGPAALVVPPLEVKPLETPPVTSGDKAPSP